jgi:hypothetical protein
MAAAHVGLARSTRSDPYVNLPSNDLIFSTCTLHDHLCADVWCHNFQSPSESSSPRSERMMATVCGAASSGVTYPCPALQDLAMHLGALLGACTHRQAPASPQVQYNLTFLSKRAAFNVVHMQMYVHRV